MSAQGVKGLETSLPVAHALLFFGLEPQRHTMPSIHAQVEITHILTLSTIYYLLSTIYYYYYYYYYCCYCCCYYYYYYYYHRARTKLQIAKSLRFRCDKWHAWSHDVLSVRGTSCNTVKSEDQILTPPSTPEFLTLKTIPNLLNPKESPDKTIPPGPKKHCKTSGFRHSLSGLPNANPKSPRFSYAISQIAPLPPVAALNRNSKSQIAARCAAFWHAISQIALASFLECP